MRSSRMLVGTTALASSVIIGPGTIVSCLNAGTLFGMRLAWVVVLSAVAAAAMGHVVGKVAAVTGQTSFSLLDRRLQPGLGTFVAYLQIVMHVVAGLCVANTLADVLATAFGVPPLPALAVWLVPTLALWVWTGGYRLVRGALSLLVLAMVGLFAWVAARTWLDGGRIAASAFVPLLPTSTAGLLVAMGIIGGACGGAILVFLPYQVKAGGVSADDTRRLSWDAVAFLGLGFGLVSLAVLAVGSILGNGQAVGNTMQAAALIGARWGLGARCVFLTGILAAVWTTGVGASYAPGLVLGDMRGWSIGDDGRATPDDVHKDLRFRLVTSAVIMSWLVSVPLFRMVPPYQVLMFALGLITLPVPLMFGVVLWTAASRRDMGEHTIGPVTTALGGVVLLFTLSGIVGFAAFLLRLISARWG